MTVEISAQFNSEVAVKPMVPLLGALPLTEHAVPQVPFPHCFPRLDYDAVLEAVTVEPVTEKPLVVTVVKGVHVVVDNVEPPVVYVVGTHISVTCNAVSVTVQEDDTLKDGVEDNLVDES